MITIEVNRSWLDRFQNGSYQDLQNSIRSLGESGAYAAHNMDDIVNHEFGHLLTVRTALAENAQLDYDDLLGDSGFLAGLDNISAYCTTGSNDNVFEGLAEIYTTHKRGIEIPDDLKDFFNEFSPHYEIP